MIRDDNDRYDEYAAMDNMKEKFKEHSELHLVTYYLVKWKLPYVMDNPSLS